MDMYLGINWSAPAPPNTREDRGPNCCFFVLYLCSCTTFLLMSNYNMNTFSKFSCDVNSRFTFNNLIKAA